MRKLFFYGLLALPFPLWAQPSIPALSKPSIYLGIGANAGRYYDKRYGEFVKKGISYSPAVVACIEFTPALAAQLSATTYTYQLNYKAENVDVTKNPNNPVVGYIIGDVARRYFVVPLLARYTLGSGTRRLRGDLLAGASVFYTQEGSTTLITDLQNNVSNRYSYSRSATYANLVLGAGLRYAVAPHVEAATELRSNLHYFGYSGIISPNLEVSPRYRLGEVVIR